MGASELAVVHELTSFARGLATKLARGFDDVEVFVERCDTVAFAVDGRALAPELRPGRLRVGMRGLRDGRLWSAHTASLVASENAAALRAAGASARPARLTGFATQDQPLDAGGFDEGIAAFARVPRDLQQIAVDLRDQALAAATSASWSGTLSGLVRVDTARTVVATRRAAGAAIANRLLVQAEAGARRERSVLRAWPADDASVRDTGARAVRSLAPPAPPPGGLGLASGAEIAVILHPRVIEELLREVAADAFTAGSAAARGGVHTGDTVAATAIRIVDSARMPGLARTFDDELTPTVETVLVEEGRLAACVASRATAAETGAAATGNGYRRATPLEEAGEALRTRLSGLSMDPGARTLAELLAGPGVVLLARRVQGLQDADRARTAFAATVVDGLVLRGGEVIGRADGLDWAVAGRVLACGGEPGLLGNAELSQEREFTGGARLPYVRATLRVA